MVSDEKKFLTKICNATWTIDLIGFGSHFKKNDSFQFIGKIVDNDPSGPYVYIDRLTHSVHGGEAQEIWIATRQLSIIRDLDSDMNVYVTAILLDHNVPHAVQLRFCENKKIDFKGRLVEFDYRVKGIGIETAHNDSGGGTGN
jgi:hypothetical protein